MPVSQGWMTLTLSFCLLHLAQALGTFFGFTPGVSLRAGGMIDGRLVLSGGKM